MSIPAQIASQAVEKAAKAPELDVKSQMLTNMANCPKNGQDVALFQQYLNQSSNPGLHGATVPKHQMRVFEDFFKTVGRSMNRPEQALFDKIEALTSSGAKISPATMMMISFSCSKLQICQQAENQLASATRKNLDTFLHGQ